MRFVVLAFLALSLVLSPLQARADNGPAFVFGGFNCRQSVPCDQSDPAFPQSVQLIALANACVSQNTGFSAPNGFFEEAAGLDGGGCLTTKSDALASLGDKRSAPLCCLRQVGANGCFMQCNMVSQ